MKARYAYIEHKTMTWTKRQVSEGNGNTNGPTGLRGTRCAYNSCHKWVTAGMIEIESTTSTTS